jgi:hypothetical protein
MTNANAGRNTMATTARIESITSVQKSSRDTRLGISLRQRRCDGPIVIADIDALGIFGSLYSTRNGSGHLQIRIGQQVVAINGMPCPALVADAVKLMKDTIGTLTIVSANVEQVEGMTSSSASVSASSEPLSFPLLNDDERDAITTVTEPNHLPAEEVLLMEDVPGLEQPQPLQQEGSEGLEFGPIVVASAKKKKRSTRVGLYLKQSRRRPGAILIADIDERGLFGGSALQIGQQILRINGTPCPLLGAEAANLIRDHKGKLTIEAVAFDDTPVVVATPPPSTTKPNPVIGEGVLAFCTKVHKDTLVGLSLRHSREIGAILIVKISDRGLFNEKSCGLHVGQKLVSINGHACPKSTAAAVRMIQQAEGKLMIEAAEINWGSTLSSDGDDDDDDDDDGGVDEFPHELGSMASDMDSQRTEPAGRIVMEDEDADIEDEDIEDIEDDDYDHDESRSSTPTYLPLPIQNNNELAFLEELERDLVNEIAERDTSELGVSRSLGTGGWGGDITLHI